MGTPAEFKVIPIPNYILNALYVLAFFRDLIARLCPYVGLPDFLAHERAEPDWSGITNEPELEHQPYQVEEVLPVVRFSELPVPNDSKDICVVCLVEFEGSDEIRRLTSCCHVFHRGCLDCWMVRYGRRTCPLCRASLVSL